MPSTIPTTEQAAALMLARESELAAKYCGGDITALGLLWTVSLDDLQAYVAANGLATGWLHTSVETFDGLFVVPDKSRWAVYEQERGHIYDESRRSFDSHDDAVRYVLSTYYMPKFAS